MALALFFVACGNRGIDKRNLFCSKGHDEIAVVGAINFSPRRR